MVFRITIQKPSTDFMAKINDDFSEKQALNRHETGIRLKKKEKEYIESSLECKWLALNPRLLYFYN
jgi:hypothetical protein